MKRLSVLQQHLVLWGLAGLLIAKEAYSDQIANIFDFSVEVIILFICLSLLVEIHRLKMGWLMSVGWLLFTGSLIVDVLDEYHLNTPLYHTLDDIDDLLRLGLIFICLSFHQAITANRNMIKILKCEIKYRKKLELQLHDIAYQDTLTEVGNRRAFFQDYDKLLQRYQSLQLIFIDVDNFKQVNDTQGHQVGDDLLKALAGGFKQQLKSTGRVYRFGGDEFVILCDSKQPERFIKNCLQQFIPLFARNKVGISYGIKAINKHDNKEADLQLIEVDQMMYQNKSAKVKKNN